MEKGHKKHFSKRAISNVISTTLMAALAVAVGLATLAWAQGVSVNFVSSYGTAINADIDKIKERLITEYVDYASASKNVTVFLINSGTIDDVAIQSITVRFSNGTLVKTLQNPILRLLPGGTVVSDLDQGQEGSVQINTVSPPLVPTGLTAGSKYLATIVTVRGAVFNADFVA